MESRIVCGTVLLLGVLWSTLASATLGEPESAIATETQLGRASIKQTDLGMYRIHEMQLAGGTVVREYAGIDGKVFAVSWSGPFLPNLKQSLGAYFAEFTAAAGTPHGNRKRLEVRQPDLVVLEAGHMRAFHGIAYLPQSLPSGVTAGDLQ